MLKYTPNSLDLKKHFMAPKTEQQKFNLFQKLRDEVL